MVINVYHQTEKRHVYSRPPQKKTHTWLPWGVATRVTPPLASPARTALPTRLRPRRETPVVQPIVVRHPHLVTRGEDLRPALLAQFGPPHGPQVKARQGEQDLLGLDRGALLVVTAQKAAAPSPSWRETCGRCRTGRAVRHGCFFSWCEGKYGKVRWRADVDAHPPPTLSSQCHLPDAVVSTSSSSDGIAPRRGDPYMTCATSGLTCKV